ncbi:MAG: DnaA/Hda family protein [Pseudomonadota bacterium]
MELKMPGILSHYRLNKAYTFENYICSAKNKYAVKLLESSVADSKSKFNPLYIYGETGSGKTHLLHATANNMLILNPKLKIVFINAEDYMNHFIAAIRYDEKHKFRAFFENRIDALFIDDIHYISSMEGTQEELYSIFNSLLEKQKKIIVSSYYPPELSQGYNEQLSSIMQGSVAAEIFAPNKINLRKIIKHKAKVMELILSAEMIEVIIRETKGNMKRLNAFLDTFDNYLYRKEKDPDLEAVRGVLEYGEW